MIQLTQTPQFNTDSSREDANWHWLPATWAIRDRDVEAIHSLAKKGLNVNTPSPSPDDNKITLLMIAAREGADQEVIAKLLELGADVHAKADNGGFDDYDAFELARRNGHKHVTDSLLAYCEGKDGHGDDEWLRAAIENDQRDLVNRLLRSSLRWNLNDALNVAIANDDYELARQLVKRGAHMSEEYTIYFANAADNLARVRFLLDCGSSPVEGLPLAARNGNVELVKLLLDNGADIDERIGSHTALHAAVAGGHFRIADLLLKKGASVNTDDGPTYHPRTPLTSAIEQLYERQFDEPFRHSCLQMIRKLLKHGADPDHEVECSHRDDDRPPWTETAHNLVWMAGDQEPQLRALLNRYSASNRQQARWRLSTLFRRRQSD